MDPGGKHDRNGGINAGKLFLRPEDMSDIRRRIGSSDLCLGFQKKKIRPKFRNAEGLLNIIHANEGEQTDLTGSVNGGSNFRQRELPFRMIQKGAVGTGCL